MCISKVKWAVNLNDSWKDSALAQEVFVTEPPPRWSSSLKGFKTVTSQASKQIGCPDFLLSGFFKSHRNFCFCCCFPITHHSFCQMQRLQALSSPCDKLVTCPECNPAFTPRPLGEAVTKNGWVGGCKKRAKCDVFGISVQDDYGYHAKLLLYSVKMKKTKEKKYSMNTFACKIRRKLNK